MLSNYISAVFTVSFALLLGACQNPKSDTEYSEQPEEVANPENPADTIKGISEPLVSDLYTADPSAHIFEGKIYIYPSHDIEANIPQNDKGDHFDMRDYHVFSMESMESGVVDHGVALTIGDVPWAGRQMWAPDAAYKDNKYYLYFPVKDKEDIFRIGVASGDKPEGPFTPEAQAIAGSYSIDPAVFEDVDGSHYMYFGGIWGGQLQRWSTGAYNPEDEYPGEDEPALNPKIARMSADMLGFDEAPKDVLILDESGNRIVAGDNDRRFFEAAWVHKYNDRYYFSYSTGDTHYICYAIGDSPYGPFTYQGVILNPVIGWTNHHSIVEFNGEWYLFYHDTEISGGQTHLRNIKVTPLTHKVDGGIETISPYLD